MQFFDLFFCNKPRGIEYVWLCAEAKRIFTIRKKSVLIYAKNQIFLTLSF